MTRRYCVISIMGLVILLKNKSEENEIVGVAFFMR